MALLKHIEFLKKELELAVFQYEKYIKILLKYGYNPKNCNSGYFVLLPDEILLEIFDYLNPYQKIYESSICFRFYNLLLADSIWKHKHPLLKTAEALVSLNIHKPLWWYWLAKNNKLAGSIGGSGKIGHTGYITRGEDDADQDIYFLYQGDVVSCYEAEDWVIPHDIGLMYQIEKSGEMKMEQVMRYAGKWINGKAEGIGTYYHTEGNNQIFDWKNSI